MSASVFAQTGWRRPHPAALCQDMAVLAQITEHTFNLYDPAFIDYARSRGVLHVAGRWDRYDFTARHDATEAEFRREFPRALEYKGVPWGGGYPITDTEYLYTDAELSVHWHIMCLAKGTLQDCWELFCAENRTASTPHEIVRVDA